MQWCSRGRCVRIAGMQRWPAEVFCRRECFIWPGCFHRAANGKPSQSINHGLIQQATITAESSASYFENLPIRNVILVMWLSRRRLHVVSSVKQLPNA